MKPETIQFRGRAWRLHTAGPKKLVFHPAKADAAPLISWLKSNRLSQRAGATILGISQGYLAKIVAGKLPMPADLVSKMK